MVIGIAGKHRTSMNQINYMRKLLMIMNMMEKYTIIFFCEHEGFAVVVSLFVFVTTLQVL